MPPRPLAQITPAIVHDIVERISAGQSYSHVARELGLVMSTVRKIAMENGVQSQVKSTAKSPWNQRFHDEWKG